MKLYFDRNTDMIYLEFRGIVIDMMSFAEFINEFGVFAGHLIVTERKRK